MSRRLLTTNEALAAFGMAFASFLLLGALLPATSATLVIRQLATIAVPAVIAVRLAGITVRTGLGLTMPRPRSLLGAALIGASFWYLNLWLVVPLIDLLSGDPARSREVAGQVVWAGDSPWLRLVVVALVPAVCEELLMRGAIARALQIPAGRAGAVLISALLFAGLHLPSPRVLPAATLGVALGYATIVTGSVLPSMVMHFANNLFAAVLIPLLAGSAALGAIEHHPHIAGGMAAATTGIGLILLRSSQDA